jgi:hypothetical protein
MVKLPKVGSNAIVPVVFSTFRLGALPKFASIILWMITILTTSQNPKKKPLVLTPYQMVHMGCQQKTLWFD